MIQVVPRREVKITPQLSSALSVGYTTDIWSSIITKSYITLMAPFISSDFEQKSYICTFGFGLFLVFFGFVPNASLLTLVLFLQFC